jgi:hypothetical protein
MREVRLQVRGGAASLAHEQQLCQYSSETLCKGAEVAQLVLLLAHEQNELCQCSAETMSKGAEGMQMLTVTRACDCDSIQLLLTGLCDAC